MRITIQMELKLTKTWTLAQVCMYNCTELQLCNGSAMFTPAQSHSQTLLEHYDYAIVCI